MPCVRYLVRAYSPMESRLTATYNVAKIFGVVGMNGGVLYAKAR